MSATVTTKKEQIVSSNGKKAPFTPVSITPSEVHQTLSRHMLADGFDMVIDLKKSQGCRIYDSRHGKKFLDFFSFFGSSALGMNHPKLATPEFMEKLAYVALNKPSNSDVYSVEMAEFVETFYRIAQPEYLPYVFFIDGGALANENAMKTAFDWKVRKNFAKGYTNERGYQVIHFRHSFHGRSGYTMSLTNTDPTKTKYFPKFKWPRIHNPAIKFPLNDEHLKQVIEEEKTAISQIKEAIINNPDDIAALIIEPIQAEGGDNHFRKEFLQELRTICDESEILLIFDEVQSGVGLTGKMWAHEWFVKPDLMSFGKKTHICGFMAGNRIDDILENVFKKASRINSTFGGNLVDMVRAKRIFEIIHEDNLVENSRVQGEYLVGQLNNLAREFPQLVSNPRGRGLMSAFDLDTAQNRNQLISKAYEEGLILIGCGDRSIRFRPPLTITQDELAEGLGTIKNALKELSVGEI
ncbi:MAG: L-lysine 6-transaminase [Ignavibacteriales bacterium]|nr:L-lysine 6-transaminase [Ignavibacteriales bacterium]